MMYYQIENIKKEPKGNSGIENYNFQKIIQMKISLKGLNRKSEGAEERISKREDRATEITPLEKQKEKE